MGSIGPCHRCGRSGHLARHCSLHTCFRCNGRGHMAWECVEGVTCSRCGERGHLQRNCRNVSCHKCKQKGHIAKFCDDPFAKVSLSCTFSTLSQLMQRDESSTRRSLQPEQLELKPQHLGNKEGLWKLDLFLLEVLAHGMV